MKRKGRDVARRVERQIYSKDPAIGILSSADNANNFDTIKSFLKQSPIYLSNLVPDANG